MSMNRVDGRRRPGWFVWTAGLILPSLAGLSCSINVHNDGDGRKSSYRTIQIPSSQDGAVSPELKAEKDEKLHRQTCTIGPDGEVKIYRSLEKEVAHLGVTLAALDPDRAKRLGTDPFGGVLVTSVEEDGPGARAGLKEDDVLTSLAGKPIVTPEQIEFLVEQSAPWTPIALKVLRDKETIAVNVELGSEMRIVSSRLLEMKLQVLDDMKRTGLKLAELTDDLRPLVLGPEQKEVGLLVVDVLPGGPGFLQGLRFKDYVLRLGDRPIANGADYTRALDPVRPGEEVVFTVVREGRTVEARVVVSDDATSTSAFNVLGLVKNKSAPSESEFSLLWGLLFDSESSYSIKDRDSKPEYRAESHWGAVLDLISYRSTAKKKEFRLLWLFPVYWTTG